MRWMLSGTGFAAVLLTGAMALAGAHEVQGKIVRVDANAHTLVVREHAAAKREIHMKLDDAAAIEASGKPGTLADLREGESVKVTTSGNGAALEATHIEILPAKAASHS